MEPHTTNWPMVCTDWDIELLLSSIPEHPLEIQGTIREILPEQRETNFP